MLQNAPCWNCATSTALDLISADFEVSRSSVILGEPETTKPDAK
jgi:hypothetical protein